MEELLKELHTSQLAFVVFDTEAARDKAVEKSEQEGGFPFEGSMLTLEVADCEPNTVMWHNLGFSSMGAKVGRLLQGIGFILLALLGWIVIFLRSICLVCCKLQLRQWPGAWGHLRPRFLHGRLRWQCHHVRCVQPGL
jgi:hypothetical protein